MSLEESSERILLLEKKNLELEHVIRSQYQELEELRHANSQLHNKLDRKARNRSLPPNGLNRLSNGRSRTTLSTSSSTSGANSPTHHSQHNQLTSLFNEIEMSSSSSIEEELAKPFANGLHDSDEDVDIECDPTPSFPNSMASSDLWKFRQEVVSSYQSLRTLLRNLHRRREVNSTNLSVNGNSASLNSSSPDSGVPPTPEEVPLREVKVGLISSVVREIQSTLKEIFPDDDGPCTSCRSVCIDRNELVKLRKDVKEKSDSVKRLTDELAELKKRVTIQEVELKAGREERDNARSDLESADLPKDEMVKRAVEMRDQAVARKNTVEIELAKTRIEVMHINSQLMETIQQKVELSQQLEQWQVDMQALIDDQLKKKLTEQEERRKAATNNGISTASTVLSSLSSKTAMATTGLMNKMNNKSKLLKLWR